MVSRVVEIDGRKYLDGGISDSIPLRFAEGICGKNIVVLTRPRDYKKKPSSHMWMFRRSLKKYPKALKAVANRHIMYNEQRNYVFLREKAGKALIICPEKPLEIGRIEHNPDKIQQTYDLGRRAAMEKLDEIRRFIENGN